MHFLADSVVYSVDAAKRTPPRARYECDGVRHVTEGVQEVAMALENGDVVVLGGDDHRRLLTGIDKPMECLTPTRGDRIDLLIGTEGAHLYRLRGDGTAAQRVKTFEELACRGTWRTPWGGPPSVRSLARTSDGWIYADIHVGSIMRSPDNGETWEPVTPTLNEDVHQVDTTPASSKHVYANTARGVYVSSDRGQT